ncbi:MAG: hypothetical protein EHM18_04345 [Acidobacteria bacterium]|nr:MAG: hypothetical protein EHM18_04345 [Acidobacteriota bacterium]
MSTMQALKKGLYDITANIPAVLLLWLTNLILALAVAWPVFGWLGRMDQMPAAEEMLRGFSLPLLFDLSRYDYSTVVRLLSYLIFWLVLGASLISTFLSGGVLTVLANPSCGPFLEQFFAGAGRYFPRFLRLLLGAGLAAGALLLALNAVLGAVVFRLSEDASEITSLLLVLGQGALNALIVTVCLLALHYARIETVVEGTTGMAGAYLRSLVFVFRNILRAFALIIFFAGLMGVVHLVYMMVRSVLPTTTWLPILLLMALQQTVVFARSGFQVGLYGGELELYLLRRPKRTERGAVVVVPRTVEPAAATSGSEGEPERLSQTNTD